MIGVAHTEKGVFVSLDGPDGVGKSTAIGELVGRLRSAGMSVHATCEPTRTPLGRLIREGVANYQGMALGCLVAGDRYSHIKDEILPHLAAGDVVVTDRYVGSSLVLQRLDGLTVETIAQLNGAVCRPDVAIVLVGAAEVVAERLAGRGGFTRFDAMPQSHARQVSMYREAASLLRDDGWHTRLIDTTSLAPRDVADIIVAEVVAVRREPETQ